MVRLGKPELPSLVVVKVGFFVGEPPQINRCPVKTQNCKGTSGEYIDSSGFWRGRIPISRVVALRCVGVKENTQRDRGVLNCSLPCPPSSLWRRRWAAVESRRVGREQGQGLPGGRLVTDRRQQGGVWQTSAVHPGWREGLPHHLEFI